MCFKQQQVDEPLLNRHAFSYLLSHVVCPQQVTLPHIHFTDAEVAALQEPDTVQEVKAMKASHDACFEVKAWQLTTSINVASSARSSYGQRRQALCGMLRQSPGSTLPMMQHASPDLHANHTNLNMIFSA